MSMHPDSEREREAISAEAAEWFAANYEPLDAAKRAQFGEWLRRSPRHQQEYLELLRLSRRLQSASAEPPSVESLLEEVRSEEPASAPPPAVHPGAARLITARRRVVSATVWRSPWLYAAAAAGIAGVGMLVLRSNIAPRPPEIAQVEVESQHYLAGHGQQLTQSLADGSVLHLDTDSAVTVRYGSGLRQVEVDRGQVVFEVAHDPARPFRVTAGSAQVVALGTQFDVYLQGEVTMVTVVEGRVSVGPGIAGGVTSNPVTPGRTPGGRQPLEVAAGQQVRVVRGELPAQPSQVDARQVTAWLHRQIAFEHEELSVVVAEFSRYSPSPIVIESPDLRSLTVSGVFNVDDPESFVAFLRSLKGVGVEVTPTRTRVYER